MCFSTMMAPWEDAGTHAIDYFKGIGDVAIPAINQICEQQIDPFGSEARQNFFFADMID